MGLVSQIASAWHGFDVQASSKWQRRPSRKIQYLTIILTQSIWEIKEN